MINMPNFNKCFDYENNFYLTCDSVRIAKLMTHYELYKKVENLTGEIVECGVFKGTSLINFIMFREILNHYGYKKVIGFDIFDKFPETNFKEDKEMRNKFIEEAGDSSISVDQLSDVLEKKGINRNVELVEGNIINTIPRYLIDNPQLKISLLNLDVDIYEPSKTVLEYLYPRIVRGGILILDDYGVFPGETKAVDDYFKDKNVTIEKLSFSPRISFIVKE